MPAATILIVDDEASNLATLNQILAAHYSLAFARSGAECLAAAKKHQPALILLDIQMPDMDGYAVCRKLKADPATENTPVIFVSSLREVGEEAAGFECGAVDYIIKPVSPTLVLARVRTHLSLVRATMLESYVQQLEIEREKIARLSRILAVLNGTNAVIVRVKEAQTLLEETCHIAVEQGGFSAAWIGMSETEDGTLTLAASQSSEPDLWTPSLFLVPNLNSVEIDLPASVLRTGNASFCNDVRTITSKSQIGRTALIRGYLSIACLPLANSDGIAGIMVLYAREANYFDDAEMKLLNELAGDISFALQAINNAQRANFLSYYDALTALPNTTLFLDRLEQLVQAARRDNKAAFVITLNFDRFKQLNDSQGRHVGDQVLRIVGKRLGDALSDSCSVARIGADNFAVAGEQASSESAGALCERIIALLNEPFVIDKQILHLSARLGIAIYPTDANDSESLFKHAEAALKQCKLTKTRYLFYSSEINARIADKVEMEHMLQFALDRQEFVLYFQPKVDLQTGLIAGAEALIRWHHPLRGIVQPLEFIPLAEETGLIVPIGEWVIRAVCAQQAAWLSEGVHIVPIALNLSSLQFTEGDVLKSVRDALSEYGLEASCMEVELTESLVMHNPDEAQKIMHAFRKLGINLSLDDFGTGYSSLAYLKRFPFHTVKIDRAFVTEITQNPDDAAIATAIIGMAHSLRMHVIAEGVETEAQLNFLRSRQCDQMQGYFFSCPVPAQDFAAMLQVDKHLELEVGNNREEQTLLVVDDDHNVLAALKRSLRGQKYRILTVPNAHEALELLATNSVQVILCDPRTSQMPGTDFLSVAAKMYPDTMRIVLSGYTELQSILNVINRGEIHRYLTKPWDDDLLRQNIREAFRRYRQTG